MLVFLHLKKVPALYGEKLACVLWHSSTCCSVIFPSDTIMNVAAQNRERVWSTVWLTLIWGWWFLKAIQGQTAGSAFELTVEWIFIPVPSHSHTNNPISSQSRTIVKIKILSRSNWLLLSYRSYFVGQLHKSNINLKLHLTVFALMERKPQTAVHLSRFFFFCFISCIIPLLLASFNVLSYRPNPVIKGSTSSTGVN